MMQPTTNFPFAKILILQLLCGCCWKDTGLQNIYNRNILSIALSDCRI